MNSSEEKLNNVDKDRLLQVAEAELEQIEQREADFGIRADEGVSEQAVKEEEAAQAAEKKAASEEKDDGYYEKLREVRKDEVKNARKIRLRDILIIAVPILLALAALMFSRSYTEKKSWQAVSGSGKQYYMGAESVIREDTELKTDDNGKVVSRSENEKIAAVPIYYDEKPVFMITEDMCYYDPRATKIKRADALTEFSLTSSGSVKAKKGDTEKIFSTGFLYNGEDMFIFLEPVTLEVNSYTIKLPALSYVEARGTEGVNIFNYETREFEEIIPETELVATVEDGQYSVLCLSDAYLRPDGKRVLLFFAPEKLDPLL